MKGSNVYDLISKQRRLIQQAHDPGYTMDEKSDMLEEVEYLKEYVCHLRGHSDITVLGEDGDYEEDYCAYVPIVSTVNADSIPYKRKLRRDRKEDIKRQLLTYYKYDNRMLKNKFKLYKTMWEVHHTMDTAFGIYGKKAYFVSDGELYTYDTHKALKKSIKAFNKEFVYITTARRTRSLLGSYLPSNFGGRHRIIVISDNSMDWLHEDPELQKFRSYITSNQGSFDHVWCGRGILTPNCLETLLRLALRPGKFTVKRPKKTDVYYNYTSTMKKYLPLPEQNKEYIENLRVQTLITHMRAEPYTEEQERMLYGRYTEEEADNFLNEMELVQQYADEVYET